MERPDPGRPRKTNSSSVVCFDGSFERSIALDIGFFFRRSGDKTTSGRVLQSGFEMAEPCPYFQKGFCQYGDRCRRSHSRTSSQQGKGCRGEEKTPCRFFQQGIGSFPFLSVYFFCFLKKEDF